MTGLWARSVRYRSRRRAHDGSESGSAARHPDDGRRVAGKPGQRHRAEQQAEQAGENGAELRQHRALAQALVVPGFGP